MMMPSFGATLHFQQSLLNGAPGWRIVKVGNPLLQVRGWFTVSDHQDLPCAVPLFG